MPPTMADTIEQLGTPSDCAAGAPIPFDPHPLVVHPVGQYLRVAFLGHIVGRTAAGIHLATKRKEDKADFFGRVLELGDGEIGDDARKAGIRILPKVGDAIVFTNVMRIAVNPGQDEEGLVPYRMICGCITDKQGNPPQDAPPETPVTVPPPAPTAHTDAEVATPPEVAGSILGRFPT